jgi:hypothetical protein
MHDRYLLLLSLLVISPFVISEVFALHYAEYGLDDRFNWREFDNENAQSVWIEFEGKMTSPFDEDRLSFTIQDGTYEGDTRYGALFLMKDLPTAMLTNGTTTTFTWQFDQSASSGVPSAAFISVMDGNYTYNSVLEATKGFPSDINYGGNGNSCTSNLPTPSNADDWFDIGASGWWLCLGSVTGAGQDLGNIYGGGYLDTTGTDMRFATSGNQASGDLISEAVSVTNAEWTEATEGVVTVFLIVAPNSADSTNYIMQPRKLTITGTDHGTLAWNFPDTEAEVDNWLLYGGGGGINNDGYEINGTEFDSGYIFSYDPSVPDPPTNLWAYNNPSGGITLLWTEPVWTGLQPIDGYQIQRESPIGGGFSTLVANTGNQLETYTDTSVIPGNEYNYRVAAINAIGTSAYSNESKDGTQGIVPNEEPDINCDSQIYELTIPAFTDNSATLCWNDVLAYDPSETRRGYQINYTSPYGEPNFIITNDTGSSGHTKLVTGLAEGTQYSFRILAWYAQALGQVFDLTYYTAGTETTGDLSDELETPLGTAISPDGKTLLVLDDWFDIVSTFNLNTAFDPSTKVWIRDMSISTEEINPTDLYVSHDGLNLHVIGNEGDGVDWYKMSSPWNTDTATHQNFQALAQIGTTGDGKSITFGNNGLKLYASGNNGTATVFQYGCTSAYNGTSCTYDTESLSVESYCDEPRGIQWDNNGDTFFCLDQGLTATVYEFSCSNNWNVTSCSQVDSKAVNTLIDQGEALNFDQSGAYMLISDELVGGGAYDAGRLTYDSDSAALQSNLKGWWVDSTGTRIYFANNIEDRVYQYSMTPAWNVTSATLVNWGSISAQTTQANHVFLKPDGTKMYVGESSNIDQWNLLTPFDITTLQGIGGTVTTNSGGAMEGFTISPDGTKLIVCAGNTLYVERWNLGTPWDLSSASFVNKHSIEADFGLHQGRSCDVTDDGKILTVIETEVGTDNWWNQYTFGTPWDVTTLSGATVTVASGADNLPYGGNWGDDGDNLFWLGDTSNELNKYVISYVSGGDEVQFYLANTTGNFNPVDPNNPTLSNIANITTLGESFNIGEIEFEAGSNPNVFDWEFVRTDSGNNTNLLVNYPNSFNASCNFDYKFAMTNQTYNNLSTLPVSDGSDRQYANFTFNNSTNDIITVLCWDNNSDSTGKYLMPQQTFPILQQIADFRNGTFGTSGQFMIFDFVTLAVIILSMIGFNRVHPGVGAVFSAIILSGAAYFDIIEDWSAILGGIVIAVLLIAMLMHHRNDVV